MPPESRWTLKVQRQETVAEVRWLHRYVLRRRERTVTRTVANLVPLPGTCDLRYGLNRPTVLQGTFVSLDGLL